MTTSKAGGEGKLAGETKETYAEYEERCRLQSIINGFCEGLSVSEPKSHEEAELIGLQFFEKSEALRTRDVRIKELEEMDQAGLKLFKEQGEIILALRAEVKELTDWKRRFQGLTIAQAGENLSKGLASHESCDATIDELKAEVARLTEENRAAVEKERERCAKIADVTQNYDGQVAALIRARGGEK